MNHETPLPAARRNRFASVLGRVAAVAALAAVIVLAPTIVPGSHDTTAMAQDAVTTEAPDTKVPETETSTTADVDAVGSIIPSPNSGHKPSYDGDRGTWPQYAVMGGILVALAVMTFIARRQMRAAKAASNSN